MKLRCWPGCLAHIDESYAGNKGKVVKCISFIGEPGRGLVGSDYWLIEEPICCSDGSQEPYAKDAWLTPITPPPSAAHSTTEALDPADVLAWHDENSTS